MLNVAVGSGICQFKKVRVFLGFRQLWLPCLIVVVWTFRRYDVNNEYNERDYNVAVVVVVVVFVV